MVPLLLVTIQTLTSFKRSLIDSEGLMPTFSDGAPHAPSDDWNAQIAVIYWPYCDVSDCAYAARSRGGLTKRPAPLSAELEDADPSRLLNCRSELHLLGRQAASRNISKFSAATPRATRSSCTLNRMAPCATLRRGTDAIPTVQRKSSRAVDGRPALSITQRDSR
jgi:hypothetical protein